LLYSHDALRSSFGSSRRRPDLDPGPITPGVNCNRRHLPQNRRCERQRSNPGNKARAGLLRRFAPRNDVVSDTPPTTVILREGGVSSTPRPFGSVTDASEYWIVRSSRTMTNIGVLATACARVLQIHRPPKIKRGRREDRVRAAPAVSCARVDKKTHMSIQVQRKHSGLPCAMALRLIPCSPR
jgi:hypothetical protein